MKKEVLRTIICVLIIFTSVFFLSVKDVFGVWDNMLSDTMNQKPSGVDHDIYIIGIDDKTLSKYGAITSWGRKLSGELVEKLTSDEAYSPRIIGFDIIFSETMDQEGDTYFADACKKAGNVVMVSSIKFKEQPETDGEGNTTLNPLHVSEVIMPYTHLRENVETGFANTYIDRDGYVRQTMTEITYNGNSLDSFASLIYKKYMKSRGEEPGTPLTYGGGRRIYFTYSGKTGSYPMISMADVLDGKVDARLFKDKIVLVGAYANGMQDAYRPAVEHGKEMYGVEIHANIIQSLLEGKTQVPLPLKVYSLLIGMAAAAFYFFTKRADMKWCALATVLCIVAHTGAVKLLYHNGYIIPVVLFPLSLLVLFLLRLIKGYIGEYIRRKKVVSVFKQYVAPQVVDKISRDKDFELVLGGENRNIAVLFVDIRGFTTISESLQPEQVVDILNDYLKITTKAIFNNKGTLDKFIGDGAMAVFNAPCDLDDYVFRAVCAAWEMQKNMGSLREKVKERYGKDYDIGTGIGIHCGEAVVGNIGCDFRMDYTAIGDTVNTASRLESNAGKGQILISEEVYSRIKDRIAVTPIGEIPLKGKNKGTYVYEVNNVR